ANIESAPLPLVAAGVASRKGHLIGFTVGANKYVDGRIPVLDFAEHDAAALRDALNQGDRAHLDSSVGALTGAEVTAQAILGRLHANIAKATTTDTLVFGFAGHGVVRDGTFVLVLPSTNLDHLETTALRWTDIEAMLAQSPARVVVFLDACLAGAAALG